MQSHVPHIPQSLPAAPSSNWPLAGPSMGTHQGFVSTPRQDATGLSSTCGGQLVRWVGIDEPTRFPVQAPLAAQFGEMGALDPGLFPQDQQDQQQQPLSVWADVSWTAAPGSLGPSRLLNCPDDCTLHPESVHEAVRLLRATQDMPYDIQSSEWGMNNAQNMLGWNAASLQHLQPHDLGTAWQMDGSLADINGLPVHQTRQNVMLIQICKQPAMNLYLAAGRQRAHWLTGKRTSRPAPMPLQGLSRRPAGARRPHHEALRAFLHPIPPQCPDLNVHGSLLPSRDGPLRQDAGHQDEGRGYSHAQRAAQLTACNA